MASLMMNKSTCRPGAFGVTTLAPRLARPPTARVVVSNSYKNLENIDLSKLPDFARHEKDTGSSEYQVARLTARLEQISSHLKLNRKDFAAKRGLQQILAQRKRLLQYLYKMDKSSYEKITSTFGIRSVVVGDKRGATRAVEVDPKKSTKK